MTFCCGNVTNNIICGINCADFILIHVGHYNEITEKPHDHLFRKSGPVGLAMAPVYFQNDLKVLKSEVLLRQCNQIYSMWSVIV